MGQIARLERMRAMKEHLDSLIPITSDSETSSEISETSSPGQSQMIRTDSKLGAKGRTGSGDVA
jgi:hypothetical protein